jgi:hypothetical protein
MSSYFTKSYARAKRCARAGALLLAAAVGLGACTEVQVEETRVVLDETTCSSSSAGTGGNNGGNGPGNQQPQSNGAVMDTAVVQIFELHHPESATPDDCNTCVASRQNCFLESETCVCGPQTSVSVGTLPMMVENLHLSIPANYGSLYCMRIMAVQRTSQAEEQCACDPSWEAPSRVRLCAVSSTPYAAGPLPVQMPVQCSDNQKFAACAADPSTMTTASMN